MSAYKKLECRFKDFDNLTQSLKDIGFKPIFCKEKEKLKGFLGDARDELADIIIPKNQISSMSNDLGFSYDEKLNEYVMICSDYDLHRGLGDKVIQSYALTAIKSALKKNKFNLKDEVKQKNKKVIINASKII